MVYETGLLVGGIGIITACVAKFKCYVKRNGSLNWGVGCQDKPLVDDDEIEVRTVDLGDVKVLYARPKHHIHNNHDSDND